MKASVILVLAVAMAAGLLFNRIAKLVHLPNVTGYLVAGLICGPSLWGLLPFDFAGFIPEDGLKSLGIVSTVALGFIAFSIGGEFKWSHIKHIGMRAITITFVQAFGAVFTVDVVLILMAKFGLFGITYPIAITLGAISAATAPAATLMVIRQYKAKGPVTDMLLPVVALDDAVGLIVFAVSFAIAKSMAIGADMTFRVMILDPLFEIICALVIGAVLGFICAFCMRFFHSKQNKLMLVLATVIAGVAIAEALNISSLLLCMAASAFLANFCNEFDSVLSLCDDWTPPLFMLFFVISGAELRLEIIPTVGVLGVLYIVCRSIGKYLGTYLGAVSVKAEDNIRKYLGITLLPQAGVAIGMATIVVSTQGFELYATKVQAVVLCATLVYELIGPLLTKMALTSAGEIEKPKPRRS